MIRLDKVTKIYKGQHLALDSCTVSINKGDFVFLVGPSGSGKSTFIKLLLREEKPTSGDVWVNGNLVNKLSKRKVCHLRRTIGCVFQDFRLLDNKTVKENVSFALEVIGRPHSVISKQVPQILELVGLEEKMDRFPSELSGGEQQRVAIARAFVNHPPLLLADEPSGNLDPKTTSSIMNLLERINKTGTTVVMATHDAGIVNYMQKRVIHLNRGSVVSDELQGSYIMNPSAESNI